MKNKKNMVPGNTFLTLLFKGLHEDAKKMLRSSNNFFDEDIYNIIKNLQLKEVNELAIHLDKMLAKIITLRADKSYVIDLSIPDQDYIKPKVLELVQEGVFKDFGQIFLAIIEISQQKYNTALYHVKNVNYEYDTDIISLSKLEEIKKTGIPTLEKYALLFSLTAYIQLKTNQPLDAIRSASIALHLNPKNTAAPLVITELSRDTLYEINDNSSEQSLNSAKLISEELINFAFSIKIIRDYGIEIKTAISIKRSVLNKEMKANNSIEKIRTTTDEIKTKIKKAENQLSEIKKIKQKIEDDLKQELSNPKLESNQKIEPKMDSEKTSWNNNFQFVPFDDPDYESASLEGNPFKNDFKKSSDTKYSQTNTTPMKNITRNSATETFTPYNSYSRFHDSNNKKTSSDDPLNKIEDTKQKECQ